MPPVEPRPRAAALSAPSNAQLRAFHAVVTHGSFTAAARALAVSQPAVSMQLKALEEAYGVELVARSARGVVATALGRELFALTRSLFTLEMAASELLGGASELLRGELRMGADAPFAAIALLASYRARHPGVKLTLSLGNSAEVLGDVRDGKCDVAALSDRLEDPRLVAIPAARSHQVLLVARTHAWAKRRSVRLAELHAAPMLVRESGSVTRRAFEEAARRAGVEPAVVMELGSREAVAEGVAAGLGVAVVIDAERAPDRRLVALPFSDVRIEHVTYVACLEERRRLRAVRALFELVPRASRRPRDTAPRARRERGDARR